MFVVLSSWIRVLIKTFDFLEEMGAKKDPKASSKTPAKNPKKKEGGGGKAKKKKWSKGKSRPVWSIAIQTQECQKHAEKSY